MELDFSKLSNLSNNNAKADFTDPLEEESHHNQQPSDLALTREQRDYQRMLDVYKEHLANKKLAYLIQTEITKGVNAGEDHTELLLKSIKLIGLLVGEPNYYRMLEGKIKQQQK